MACRVFQPYRDDLLFYASHWLRSHRQKWQTRKSYCDGKNRGVRCEERGRDVLTSRWGSTDGQMDGGSFFKLWPECSSKRCLEAPASIGLIVVGSRVLKFIKNVIKRIEKSECGIHQPRKKNQKTKTRVREAENCCRTAALALAERCNFVTKKINFYLSKAET